MPYFRAVIERFLTGARLVMGGVDVLELAVEFGTPLYVVDTEAVRQRAAEYLEAAAGGHVAFACKANSTLGVLRVIREAGLGADAASEGEWEAARRAGFEPGQITLHGNAKSDAELRIAVEQGAHRVVLDCFEEIERLEQIADGRGIDVLVRVAPGVDPETHAAISTGQADTKFGFGLTDGSAARAVELARSSVALRFRGLHFHVGSQLMDGASHLAALGACAAFCREHGPVEDLVLGGGLGIRYTEADRPQDVRSFVGSVVSAAHAAFGGSPPRLGFEPGRSIVGEAGCTLYRVVARKQVGPKSYLAVDGGMADNPRPQLYGATYTAFNASQADAPHSHPFTVAGRHCETDTLIGQVDLPPDTQAGDVLLVPSTGAYAATMASNYNRYPRPATVLVEGGVARPAVRRECLDDLFRTETV